MKYRRLLIVSLALLTPVRGLIAADKPATAETTTKVQPGMMLDAKGLVMTRPGFSSRPHILLVNTAGAVSDADLFDMLCAVRRETLAVVWTNAVPKSLLPGLLAAPTATQHSFYGTNTVLMVLVERAPDTNPLLVAPGTWVRLNLNGIDADKPAPATLKTRLNRAALRAVAYGAGAGATMHRDCLMFSGVADWRDLAKTGPNFSPDASMPIMRYLNAHHATASLSQLWKLGAKGEPAAPNK